MFEERFILKICGYPLCDNQLGSIPKHKFKISTSVNKVYDITERKVNYYINNSFILV